jgi:hypothetical protein
MDAERYKILSELFYIQDNVAARQDWWNDFAARVLLGSGCLTRKEIRAVLGEGVDVWVAKQREPGSKVHALLRDNPTWSVELALAEVARYEWLDGRAFQPSQWRF